MGNFMGYNSATELFTAIGTKIKAKYTKPSGGIPKSDLASAVQTSLDQVDANKANILFVANRTVKNLLDIIDSPSGTSQGITYTNNGDQSYTVKGTSTGNDAYITLATFEAPFPEWLTAGTKLGLRCSNVNARLILVPRINGTYQSTVYAGFSDIASWTVPQNMDRLIVRFKVSDPGVTVNDNNVRGMICYKSLGGIDPSIVPGAKPNSNLTVLEAEDRAALAEEIDAGAKNKFQITQASTTGYTVNSDGTVTASGALSKSEFNMGNFLTGTLSNLVLSGCTGGSDSTYCLLFQYRISGGNVQAIRQYDDPVVINLTNVTWSALYIEVKSLSAGQTKIFKPMVATKAAFGVSQKFVPYRLPYDELIGNTFSGDFTQDKLDNLATGITGGAVPANLITGITSASWVVVHTYRVNNENTRKLQVVEAMSGTTKRRTYEYNTWSAWS